MRILVSILFVVSFIRLDGQVRINQNNQLFVNYNGNAIGASDFVVSKDAGTFAGMYTNSNAGEAGKPFYGYAVNGGIRSFTYFDELADEWRLNLMGSDRIIVQDDTTRILRKFVGEDLSFFRQNSFFGREDDILLTIDVNNDLLLFNTENPINSSTDFTLKSRNFGFGGMYIDSPDDSNGLPFYGYAIDSDPQSYHYFDATDSRWKLFVENQNNENITFTVLQANHNFLEVTNALGINTGERFDESTTLTVKAITSGFGGMYVDSPDGSTGKPYYGYGINGDGPAYHYYDGEDGKWKLYVGDPEFSNVLEAKSDFVEIIGGLGINTDSDFNGVTELTIETTTNDFGGMYINSLDGSSGKPFYGYGINGTNRANHYFDEADDEWKLFVDGGEVFSVSDNEVKIDGSIELQNYANGAAGPEGTIYYHNNAFWGKIGSSTARRLDNIPSAGNIAAIESKVDALEKENQELRSMISSLSNDLKRVMKSVTVEQKN